MKKLKIHAIFFAAATLGLLNRSHAATSASTYENDGSAPGPNRRTDDDAQFCLITHYTRSAYPFAKLAESSHRRYAARHGYAQQTFTGRISGDFFLDPTRGASDSLRGGGLYWQKLTAIEHVLTRGLEQENGEVILCAWVVWLDSDVVITNETTRLQDIVATYAKAPPAASLPTVDVVLVPDDQHPVSGGVVFVRNTSVGLSFVKAVSALYPAYKDNLLPEQTAMATVAYMAEPWPSSQRVPAPQALLHPSVVVAPHRAFNSFPDCGRNLPQHVRWQPCDFVAHFAGVRHAQREAGMREVLATRGQCEPGIHPPWLPPLRSRFDDERLSPKLTR